MRRDGLGGDSGTEHAISVVYVRGWADSGWSEDGPSESGLYTIRIFRSRSIIRAFAGGSLRKWVGGVVRDVRKGIIETNRRRRVKNWLGTSSPWILIPYT